MSSFARQAMFQLYPGEVYKVRVVEYLGNNKFKVVDRDDTYRIVHRNALTFLAAPVRRSRPSASRADQSHAEHGSGPYSATQRDLSVSDALVLGHAVQLPLW